MLRVRYPLSSLLIVLLAVACTPEPEEVLPNTGVFGFSADPISQTVALNDLNAASLSPQQTSAEPRTLSPSKLQR